MKTQDPYDGKPPNDRKRKATSTGFPDRNPKRQNTGRSAPHSQNRTQQMHYRSMQPGNPLVRNQSRQNRSNAHARHGSEDERTLIHYREQVLKSKQEELKKVRSHLQTFTKEKQWLLEKKPYYKFDHFHEFPGHRNLGQTNQKNPSLSTDLFKDMNQYNQQPRENSVGEYKDLNDPQICSRYRLGIAPVFGENLIFETPLASLAMSTSAVPDSLPEIEELESRQQEIDDQLQELQETIGKRIEPVQEPARQKSHWDFLMEEMRLMAEDFARESKWKISNAKKISRAILKHFDKAETKNKNRAKIQRARLRKLSATMSKEVALFWGKIGKIYRVRTDIDNRIEELKISNEKLETFVAETEDYAANLKISNEKLPENEGMDIDNPVQDRKEISDAAKRMEQIAKNQVELSDDYRKKTPIPSLLRFGVLRDYQHVGLHWLASLHRNKTNGILADEMGLGKTIQTISLLAHLALVEENWGPHLIIVPSSVIVNWEMEFKRWLPAFKILSYHGTKKEREAKRAGWSRDNAFHACITSYNLVVREAKVFRRRRWQYLILDEAHQIKNFESKRWQTLLNFNTQDRLLLTGTPLQNNLQELWSLLHFLMPNVFESQIEFTEWFENPVNGMISRNQDLASSHIINRLHSVLKPFLLRRQKKDVEKQLPAKKFHVIKCRLSRRQRRLYEDFMATDRTKAIMQRSDYMGMMNIVMQLRKVCNHPDLFEGRAIRAPLITEGLRYHVPGIVANDVIPEKVTTNVPLIASQDKGAWQCNKTAFLETKRDTILRMRERPDEKCAFPGFLAKVQADLRKEKKRFRESMAEINAHRCKEFGQNIADAYHAVKIRRLNSEPHIIAREKHLLVSEQPDHFAQPGDLYRPANSSAKPFFPYRDIHPTYSVLDMVKLPERRLEEMHPIICKFIEYHPPVIAPPVEIHSYAPPLARWERQHRKARHLHRTFFDSTRILHKAQIRRKMNFPERRLIQWDCGKLQALDKLLRKLKEGKHRCLIFSQMSKMLNVLEAFLNLYDYRYIRLDGSTKTEDRGKLMHRFNADDSIFCFILSTRSGGLGMNLTGADTVIFYDNDWNPAMDMQAQDRCHRIGQTREVHIYKLMSENTIEENILKKAEKKKEVMQAVMGDNAVTMDIFRDLDPWELLGMETKEELTAEQVKRAMELAEDVEDREAANVAWQEAKMQAEDELVCDEHRERARWETAIELLNPIEKYALSFFGEDRRPDPTISIKLLEYQCRQLEKKLDQEMRYLRELNHIRPRQELTLNVDTVHIALKNIKLIPGVHFTDVEKVADINFKHYGIHRGPVSLLASDENVHDWGLFSNQKEIDLMLPRPKKRRVVAGSENEASHVVKKVMTKEIMRTSIRIDDQMNVHIPWCLLPKNRQPNLQKPRNGLRAKTNLEQKSRPFQPMKSRKRPTKQQVLPWNKREEKWISRHTGFSSPFIEVKMHSHRQFNFKGRRSGMIQAKLQESKSGTLRNRRADSLDVLNHESLKLVVPGKEKFDDSRKKHHLHLNPEVQNPKGPTFESLVHKLKNRNMTQNISTQNMTPKNVLLQQIQAQEMQRTHQITIRQRQAAITQNFAMHRAQQLGMNHYLQSNPNFAQQMQTRMGNPQYQRMMMLNQDARYQAQQRLYQQHVAAIQVQKRQTQK